jgi:hypothetical protein
MHYLKDNMEKIAKIRPEDIAFWILMAMIVAVAVWKLFGSPTDTASLIAVALFVVGSEILVWKAFFSMDKKVSCGFMKIGFEMNEVKKDMNNKFDNINIRFDNVNTSLNEIKHKIEKSRR